MFKIIPNYSAHLANIIGRFQKNIKVQKQRPVFAATQRRRVELLRLVKIMVGEIPTSR